MKINNKKFKHKKFTGENQNLNFERKRRKSSSIDRENFIHKRKTSSLDKGKSNSINIQKKILEPKVDSIKEEILK